MRKDENTNYILPTGNVQISFSGGRTSGFMLHQILEANNGLPDCSKVIFSNTGREMPQTLDYVAASDGIYRVTLTPLTDLVENETYTITITSTGVSGLIDVCESEETAEVKAC